MSGAKQDGGHQCVCRGAPFGKMDPFQWWYCVRVATEEGSVSEY